MPLRKHEVKKRQVQPLKKKAERLDFDESMQMAEKFIDEFEFEKADFILEAMLSQNNTYVPALELRATTQLEVGSPELAYDYLVKAVRLSPAHGFSKYMKLGQLSEPREACAHYQQGIRLMQSDLAEALKTLKESFCPELDAASVENFNFNVIRDGLLNDLAQESLYLKSISTSWPDTTGHPDGMRRYEQFKAKNAMKDGLVAILEAISNGYCQIAELHLVDLCDEPDAAAACHGALVKALRFNDKSLDALTNMASYWISTSNDAAASKMAQQAYQVLLPEIRKDDAYTLGALTSPLSFYTHLTVTQTEIKVSLSKIFIELSMFNEAMVVLQSILLTDDEMVDVWFLLGFVYKLTGQPARAAKHFKRVFQLYEQNHLEADELAEHAHQHLADVESLAKDRQIVIDYTVQPEEDPDLDYTELEVVRPSLGTQLYNDLAPEEDI